jgi:hypothetical protein
LQYNQCVLYIRFYDLHETFEFSFQTICKRHSDSITVASASAAILDKIKTIRTLKEHFKCVIVKLFFQKKKKKLIITNTSHLQKYKLNALYTYTVM